MTPLTIGKIIAAERSFIVMTARAALRALRRKVHRRCNRGHLFSARGARPNRVTLGAV